MKNNRAGRIMWLLAELQSRKGCSFSDLTEITEKRLHTTFREPKVLKKVGLPTRFDKTQYFYFFEPQSTHLSPSDRYFVEDEKFDLHEYFGYAWSILREGQIYDVKLRFCPVIAAEVADVQWHRTQTASFEHDGSVILKFRVDGLNEIIWWILGYSDQVEVLAPKVLRQRVAHIAAKMADSHQI